MTLASLADLTDLPPEWQNDPDAEKALAVASTSIRDAAGSAIGVLTSTVTVTGGTARLLRLPGPVTAVTAVEIDGTAVTDYTTLAEGLWRQCGWSNGCGPVPVAVSLTHGLTAVPEDVVDLCAQLAVSWLQHNTEGGGSTAGLRAVAIDDASESYTDESAGQVSPVFIPEATRRWLAARFGGGVAVVETA